MPSLIVIRIVPPQPLKPGDFQSDYLNPSIGPLQITAFELSFNDPTVGKSLGTAKFVAAPAAPSPDKPASLVPSPPVMKAPKYTPSPTTGIVQNYGLEPSLGSNSAFFIASAVATAVIEIPTAAKIENLRLVAQWGSGAGATPVPVNQLYYDVQTGAGPAPDLNAWSPSANSTSAEGDPWLQQLTPSDVICS